MKQIINKLIPFKGFSAMNICGVLFVREGCRITEVTLQHESIHTSQMKELLYIGFYIIYALEWLFRVLFTKDRFSVNAYYSISFEKEAYAHQSETGYLEKRNKFAQWHT